MPLELQIIRANEFVRLGASEQLEFKESKEALALLARACRKRGVHCALLDVRAMPIAPKPRFKPSELSALVETFREEGFSRNQRLAVLYRRDPHRRARMFAFIGRLRGWNVQAFDDFEEALLWLSQEKTSREPGEQEVPIHLAKRKIEITSGMPQRAR